MIRLRGANMDIDLVTPEDAIAWTQDRCPWNKVERAVEHRCAVKNVSICPYFRGIEYLDTVLCAYPGQDADEASEQRESGEVYG